LLANLDVLIGTVVILLGVSLVVTIVNQVLSTALALRGRNLRWGLAMLMQELHPEQFKPPHERFPLFSRDLNQQAKDAMALVLEFPLVSDSKAPLLWWRLASAIRFEELIKTILLLGEAGRTTSWPSYRSCTRVTDARKQLIWLREHHRITEPWFNSVMDRVSQRFAMHLRIYSIAVSVVVVMSLGMDTLFIVNTLRRDATLRADLAAVGSSLAQSERLDPEAQKMASAFARAVSEEVQGDRTISSLFVRDVAWTSIPGMLLSVVLLSLGAPFWFMVLKNLISLRSVVARKEQQEQTASSPDVGDQIRVRSF
jgi:hypothetical protein